MDYKKYIEDNTIRCEASHRGGGIEINLDELLDSDKGYKMTAYQNYLGGGMLGSIGNSYNFDLKALNKNEQVKVEVITDKLNRYYHGLTNHEEDEWESATYEQNQTRSVSGY